MLKIDTESGEELVSTTKIASLPPSRVLRVTVMEASQHVYKYYIVNSVFLSRPSPCTVTRSSYWVELEQVMAIMRVLCLILLTTLCKSGSLTINMNTILSL